MHWKRTREQAYGLGKRKANLLSSSFGKPESEYDAKIACVLFVLFLTIGSNGGRPAVSTDMVVVVDREAVTDYTLVTRMIDACHFGDRNAA